MLLHEPVCTEKAHLYLQVFALAAVTILPSLTILPARFQILYYLVYFFNSKY